MKNFIELQNLHKKASHEIGEQVLEETIDNILDNPSYGQEIPETDKIRYIKLDSVRKNEKWNFTYYFDQSIGSIILLGIFKEGENILNHALRRLALEVIPNNV